MAIKTKPKGIKIENAIVKGFIAWVYLLFAPIDWNEEENPWYKCNARKKKDKTYNPTLTGLSNL